MSLRNYVYISKNKLDTYYPQIGRSGSVELTGKASLNVWVLKAELGAKETTTDSDHARLEAVLRHLEARGVVGTIDKPKQFFAGEFDARSIIHGRMVFFSGFRESSGKRSWLGLTCSLDNMIGYGYRDLPNYSQTSVGPTRSEHFVATSSSMAFAWTLQTIWEKEQSFVSSDFDAEAELKKRWEELQLSSEEQNLIQRRAVLNGLILFVHPAGFLEHWLREMFLAPFVDPIMWLLIGKSRYRAKVDALRRQKELAQRDVARLLSAEELKLLDAIRTAATNINSPAQRYEFVALRLLEGEVRGERILLGSPFYLGEIFGAQRSDVSS